MANGVGWDLNTLVDLRAGHMWVPLGGGGAGGEQDGYTERVTQIDTVPVRKSNVLAVHAADHYSQSMWCWLGRL